MNFLITKILSENLVSDPDFVSNYSALQKLNASKSKKVIAIRSSKGYGKSTLLSHFVTQYDLKYCYYKLDTEDDNLFTFLNYLIHAIDNAAPGFLPEIEDLLKNYKNAFIKKDVTAKNTVIFFANALINHIYSKIKEQFYIVIDDAENLHSFGWSQLFLNHFIENSTPNIHFIFTTTNELPFDEVKFRLKGNYIEITNKDLTIDTDVIKRIAQSSYSLDLSPKQAKFIEERTTGWITGVHIFLQSMNSDLDTHENDSLSETMNYFFENEILFKIEKKYADVLIKSSLFDNFDEEFLSHIFKSINVKYLFDLLKTKYSFVIKNNNDGSYEYLSFFSDFLKEKSNKQYSESDLKKLYTSAAQYWSKKADTDRAVHYLTLSQDHKKLIPVLMKGMSQYVKSGDFHIIDRWINNLPEDVVAASPSLIFYKGLLAGYYINDYTKAIEFFDKCIKNKNNIKEEHYVKSICIKAEILSNNMQAGKSLKLLSGMDVKTLAVKHRLQIQYGLILTNYFLGKLDNVINLADATLKLLSSRSTPENDRMKYNILNYLGNVSGSKGDFKKATYYYKLCAENTELALDKVVHYINYINASICLGNFEVYYEINEKLNSYSLIKNLPNICCGMKEIDILYAYELGNVNEIIAEADLLIELGVKLNKLKSSLYAYIAKAKLFYYLHEHKKMNAAIATANELNGKSKDNYYQLIMLLINVSNNDVRGVKECLNYYGANESFDDKIYTYFRLAELLIKRKEEKEAVKVLLEVFSLSEKVGFYNCAIKEFIFRKEIYDFAIHKKINKIFIQNLVSEIFYRKKFIRDFERIYDIKVLAFGIPKIMVRGVIIDDSKWKRNKFKLMFIYLLLNKDTHITKDILIEEFFPDSDPGYTDNIFHQFLSNMRGVLKIPGSKYSPEFITYKNKYFEINPDCIVGTDHSEFQTLIKKANTLKNNAKAELLEKIINSSNEEFMKGFYDTWIEDMREGIRASRIKSVKSAIEFYKDAGNYEKTILYYMMLLNYDNLNEEYYIEIIKIRILCNDLSNAKLNYKNMLDTFKKELGELPSDPALKTIKEILLK